MAKKIKSKPIISIKDMTGSELMSKIKQLKTDISKYHLEKTLARQKNVRLVFNSRKELARALTALKIINLKNTTK